METLHNEYHDAQNSQNVGKMGAIQNVLDNTQNTLDSVNGMLTDCLNGLA